MSEQNHPLLKAAIIPYVKEPDGAIRYLVMAFEDELGRQKNRMPIKGTRHIYDPETEEWRDFSTHEDISGKTLESPHKTARREALEELTLAIPLAAKLEDQGEYHYCSRKQKRLTGEESWVPYRLYTVNITDYVDHLSLPLTGAVSHGRHTVGEWITEPQFEDLLREDYLAAFQDISHKLTQNHTRER